MTAKTQTTRTKKNTKSVKRKEEPKKSGPSSVQIKSLWMAAQAKASGDLDKHIEENESQSAAAQLGQNISLLQAEAEADPFSRMVEGATARYGVVRSARRFAQYKGEAKEFLSIKDDVLAVKNLAVGLYNQVFN